MLANMFSFSGRAPRAEYWLITVLSTIGVVLGVVLLFQKQLLHAVLGLFLILTSSFVSWAVMIRRFHDLGQTGWFSLLVFLPGIGWLVPIIIGVLPGQKEANKYGPPASASRAHYHLDDAGENYGTPYDGMMRNNGLHPQNQPWGGNMPAGGGMAARDAGMGEGIGGMPWNDQRQFAGQPDMIPESPVHGAFGSRREETWTMPPQQPHEQERAGMNGIRPAFGARRMENTMGHPGHVGHANPAGFGMSRNTGLDMEKPAGRGPFASAAPHPQMAAATASMPQNALPGSTQVTAPQNMGGNANPSWGMQPNANASEMGGHPAASLPPRHNGAAMAPSPAGEALADMHPLRED
ncbi:DUF805 domain-containing protein [Thermopetrobacter sp. TC1]|uniref:DUF805 domain-containing protein n=1 Tax=Thermopetrobacter sp. TC1 TaxID=1495045 RepID=UPI0018CEE79A|nr:DUF805 domain-containing protein [Thermopetrobacter sp. TC1]